MKSMIKGLTAILLFVFIFSGTAFGQSTTVKNEDKALKLKEMGLLSGSAGGFGLDRTPTRLEAAVMFVRLLGKEAEAKKLNNKFPFTDVPASAGPYIGYLCGKGLSKGISNKLYGSNQSISASEFATYILRALGYNDNWGAFDPKYSLEAAWSIGLIDKDYYENLKTKTFLKDDAVAIYYSALSLCLYGKTQRLVSKLIDAGVIKKETAEKAGINTTADFYTLQDYGEVNGALFFNCIKVELDSWYGSAFKPSTKAIKYKIDNSLLPEKAKGYVKLGLCQVFKTSLTKQEIIGYIDNMTAKGWVRDTSLGSDGYFRFYCGANNGWLISLLDSQNNVLAYTLVHFLGVGDNMPEELQDATYRYEKIDLGTLGGVQYTDCIKIYGLYGSVVPMVDRSKLPESMKGFKKIGLLTMADVKNDDKEKKSLTEYVLKNNSDGSDYSDDVKRNTTSMSGKALLVTIYDESGKSLGYCIFRKVIITPQ